MSTTQEQRRVVLRVAADRLSLQLGLGGPDCQAPLDPAEVVEAIRVEGVRPFERWSHALAEALAAHRADPTRQIEVELHAQAPEPGRDGTVAWHEGCDPQATWRRPREHEQRVDFYGCSSFVLVGEGQALGRCIPPVHPVEGVDVFGQAVAPPGAGPVEVTPGEGVAQRGDELIATHEGVLSYEDGVVAISPLLHVDSDVDFSTGQIHFRGSVLVEGTIRDLFTVRATGSLEVRGMIEAADVAAGESIHVMGGVAAREKGWLEAGGDLVARYLSSLSGRVHGRAFIERQVDHCQFVAAGGLEMNAGRVSGGELVLGTDSQVGELGSPQGQRTRIVLGSHPPLERLVGRLSALLQRLDERLARRREAVQAIEATPAVRRSAGQKEQMTLLLHEADLLTRRRQRWEEAMAEANQRLEQARRAAVTVERVLHPGVTIANRQEQVTTTRTVKGPCTIGTMPEGILGIQRAREGSFSPLQGSAC